METNHPPAPAIQPIPLEAGKTYTIYSCSDSAMTTRREIRMRHVLPDPEFLPAYVNATKGKWRLGTFKTPPKRTLYYLDVNAAGTLVLPGTGHVQADHEAYNSFSMSATINLAATPEQIRELVALNINSNFTHHDTLIAYPEPLNLSTGNNGILVYPDAPTHHAVIIRMRETLTKGDV
ncbi:MAG: hypothetical protein QM627_05230 [Luteolibacter sp.]